MKWAGKQYWLNATELKKITDPIYLFYLFINTKKEVEEYHRWDGMMAWELPDSAGSENLQIIGKIRDIWYRLIIPEMQGHTKKH